MGFVIIISSIALILMLGIIIILVCTMYENIKETKEELKSKDDTISRICSERDIIKIDLTKERGRNKSVEVRTGFIMERAVPFLKLFDEDPKNIRHLGGEIDYIVFNENSIVFVEVKTGKARLSKKQNNIKRLIKEGKVEFKLIRMD